MQRYTILCFLLIFLVCMIMVKSLCSVAQARSRAKSEFQNSIFNLHNKRILFYGPAVTSMSDNPPQPFEDYDIVIITNNMVTKIHELPLSSIDPHKIILLCNSYFSQNFTDLVLNSGVGGILCTTFVAREKLQYRAKQNGNQIKICKAPKPMLKSWPLGLTFVLKFATTQNIKGLDIVGVTFYDKGQQYVSGYKLLEQGTQHNVAFDKEYTRRAILKNPNIFIDYDFSA